MFGEYPPWPCETKGRLASGFLFPIPVLDWEAYEQNRSPPHPMELGTCYMAEGWGMGLGGGGPKLKAVQHTTDICMKAGCQLHSYL